MPLTEQELAQINLYRRYCGDGPEEIAHKIAVERRSAEDFDRTAAAVELLLEGIPLHEHPDAKKLRLLEADVERLSQERDFATQRATELARRLDEDAIEGKMLSSYQRLVLGLARKRFGEGVIPVATVVDQLDRMGLSLDEKTVRRIFKVSQERFAVTVVSLPESPG